MTPPDPAALARALFDRSPDAVVVVDPAADRLVELNPAALRLTGLARADLLALPATQLVRAEAGGDDARVRAALAGAAGLHAGDGFALRSAAAPGGWLPVTLTVDRLDPDPLVLVVARADRDRREARTLEAVGRLAGGIAHDFNNLLTVVLGNLELVRAGAGLAEAAELLAGADRAARQAADLTRQLLGFAGRRPVRPAPLDLNALASDVLAIVRPALDPRVEVRFAPAAGLPVVSADPVEVQQAVMNLCRNAGDAMPDGGVLAVETGRAAALPDRPGPEPAGGFVRLTVTDTGVGMAEEVRSRAFEPFFTTKGVGQGTGLGLAVVYGVAAAHGGVVTCASAPGQGARFDLYLPCAPDPEPPAPPG